MTRLREGGCCRAGPDPIASAPYSYYRSPKLQNPIAPYSSTPNLLFRTSLNYPLEARLPCCLAPFALWGSKVSLGCSLYGEDLLLRKVITQQLPLDCRGGPLSRVHFVLKPRKVRSRCESSAIP